MSNTLSSKPDLRPSSEAKREAIIAAAARAFFADGYEAVSIEQVAADAGVSKVTVYSHFGGKPGLFSAAVEAECARMGKAISLEDIGTGPIEERLTNLGRTFQAFLSRSEIVNAERRIAAETERDPEIGACFLNAGPRRMHGALGLFMAHAAEQGELSLDDPMLAAEQFASMCKGFGDLERRFGARVEPAASEARVKGAVATFLRAYGTRK